MPLVARRGGDGGVELKLNHGRTRLDLNGALSWPDRSLVHRQEERITGAATIRLFDDLAARHLKAQAITVVLDNARYDRSRERRVCSIGPDAGCGWSTCSPARPI